MPEHIALYVLAGSSVKGQSLLEEIRASDYIDEINSGEGPREECGLYTLVELVSPAASTVFNSENDVLSYHTKLVQGGVHTAAKDASWNTNCILIADNSKSDLVDVLELKGGKVQDRLKAKARSAIEVASNVSIQNMSIQEYKDQCGNAEVYDALQ